LDILSELYHGVVMKVKIKTCTPIWTGGFEAGKCDRIHETGILGSLRWWMEVLVRGMGGDACDQTEQKCLYDSKKVNKGLCKVCEVFGATDWKRQFRLEVQDIKISDAPKNGTFIPKNGTFIIQIQRLNPNFDPEIIAGLIEFIADWSALGARPQMGFGVIEIEGDRIPMQSLYNWLISTSGNKKYPDLPSLRNIFLAKIKSKNSINFTENSTDKLKYDLRQMFRTSEDKSELNSRKPILKEELCHFVMGAGPSKNNKDKKMASKVKISLPYKDDESNTLMRVWGWIPEEADVDKTNWNREKIVTKIHEHLANEYNLKDWYSIRDTSTGNETEMFLRSLFQLEG